MDWTWRHFSLHAMFMLQSCEISGNGHYEQLKQAEFSATPADPPRSTIRAIKGVLKAVMKSREGGYVSTAYNCA